VNVQLLNLQEQLDSIDVIRRATGIRIQDGYNLILRKGWTRPTRTFWSCCAAWCGSTTAGGLGP